MINIDKPTFAPYIGKLAEAAGMEIKSYGDMIKAAYNRIDFFHEAGCRISDHALDGVPYCEGIDVSAVFAKAMNCLLYTSRKEVIMANSDFQAFLDELVMRNDIVDIISEYTVLKRSGNRMMGLCPLHNDKKSPSLTVSPDKQVFHCFGCGAGGSVIQFVEAAMHLDFMDAVKYLADRAHMTVPDSRSSGDKQRPVSYTHLICACCVF